MPVSRLSPASLISVAGANFASQKCTRAGLPPRMSPFLISEIDKAIVKTGCQPHRMVSGAGHDAMIMAEKVPSAMIFLRTPGGISHDPAESVAQEDVEKALECGLHLLGQLAASPEFYKRKNRA